jgi:hypothetical protein
MIDYFTKARELGSLLHETEEFAAWRDLRDKRDQKGAVDEEQYQKAESAFDDLVAQVIDILRVTVYGQLPRSGSVPCGGSVPCDGCHACAANGDNT